MSELPTERRTRQKQEHHDTYEALALTLGKAALLALVPFPLSRIREALDAGDEHLNKWGNAPWDRAVMGPQPKPKKPEPGQCRRCKGTGREPEPEYGRGHPDWPYRQLRANAHTEPWRRKPTLSLSQRVCALKHVARQAALELEATS